MNEKQAKVLTAKGTYSDISTNSVFHLTKEKQKLQGARCMACGVPFCQAGMMIGGMASGCPLHNLVSGDGMTWCTQETGSRHYYRLTQDTTAFRSLHPECVRHFVRLHVPVT